MTTQCGKCMFSSTSSPFCEFNIPTLLRQKYTITKDKEAFNTIQNYKCSYAFSQKQYDEHKENLPENFKEYVKQKNAIPYYLLANCLDKNSEEIYSIYKKYICTLPHAPKKVSIISNLDKKDGQLLLDQMKKEQAIKWKIHNFLFELPESDVFDTVIGTNQNKQSFLWYVSSAWEDMSEELSYLNFMYSVMHPKQKLIRRKDNSLDGICITFANLQALKSEHQDYIEILKTDKDQTLYYYE